ncbi:hypothetical protein QBC47DRAFT_366339 [Echria macrotheca]|uniref:Uncharacterized protein n=1 Tax=Echria macrotheca TaxID=438768 RepID=A0AAJ0BKR5_9PEZI|nr:hypothetical protein QBC47DRAFT_366339 [Echria macrotheca]
MWLINTTNLKLEYFVSCGSVAYAILSHTWGDEEISFHEFQALQPPPPPEMWKSGYRKVAMVCQLAKTYGLNYA